MLVSMKEMLEKAKQGRYAVAAPNVWDLYSIRESIDAATEENSPIILDIGEFMWDILELGRVAADLALRAPIPVAINLDHGQTFEDAIKAIRAGFTSVMVDRSKLSFDENVRQVKEIVRIAHVLDMSVEAELGHVGEGLEYEKSRNEGLTDPKKAAKYVRQTGVDCLAVAIGTAHGTYKGIPHLDYERLEEIRASVDVPLVLHGGSGTGDEALVRAINRGICKVNLFTDLSNSGLKTLREHLNSDKEINLWTASNIAFKGYKQKLIHYIRLFNSTNKAQQIYV